MLKRYIIYILLLPFCASFASSKYAGELAFSYLQTDRNCYISGDIIFLKGYHLLYDANVVNENALYVDLASPDDVFILGEMLELKNGLASGQLNVPDSLKTGEYKIRIYTNYSRDFKKDPILFSKKIYVTNRFGNNGPIQISAAQKYLIDHDSIVPKKETNSSLMQLEMKDTLLGKRSKVEMELVTSRFNGFNGALSVKSVSSYEWYLESNTIRNHDFVENEINSLPPKATNKFINESKGIVYYGNIKSKISDADLPELMVLIAFEDSVMNLRYAKVNHDGEFCFLVNSFYNKKIAYVSVYHYPSMRIFDEGRVTLQKKFIESGVNKPLDFSNGYEISGDSLNLQKAIISKAYDISNVVDTLGISGNAISETATLCGEISQSINIDDYVALPDFIQIVKEIVSSVKLKIRKNQMTFLIFDGINNVVRQDPMLFIDGVPITDYDPLLKWGTNKIKNIEVQVEPRYFGDVPFANGMVFIWTRNMDFWKNLQVENTHAFDIIGFQKERPYAFPEYMGNEEMQLPDFRQTLYWDPMLTMRKAGTKNISFYTSDEPGTFEIILEGVSDSGDKVFVRKYFHVK